MLTELPDQAAPAATEAPPSWAETFGAAWTAETVRTDAWMYAARQREKLFIEIRNRLPDDARERVFNYQQHNAMDMEGAETLLLDEAGKLRAAGDPVWAELPATREQMTEEVNRRRLDVLDDAEAIMGAGSGVAGFLGGMARAATDQTSLAMAPFGAGGTLLRVTAKEAALGTLGEAAVLPREFQVADELGLESPGIVSRLAMGAAFGGIIGGATAAVGHMVSHAKVRRQAARVGRPDDVSQHDHEDEIAARRHAMEFGFDEAFDEDSSLGGILHMSDFDFAPGGNASPQTNRAGYIFGRLIALGYEPHVAAGLVGNFMSESGVGLNTRAVGDGGNAFGIAQWNGPRRHAYLAYARQAGKDPADLDTQIAFVHHELTGPEAAAMARIAGASNAREAAALVSQYYERPGVPHLPKRMAYAGTLMEQYDRGQVPRWEGAVSPSQEGATSYTGYGTSRGYTGTGQMRVGDDMRIDVSYEVVDASLLRRASGDLQPRDRSRATSDAWINDTAAQLDPALLMPGPTADRGTPLIGPDNVIESGNGRFAAIERAFEKFPDRADAYRQQIEQTTGAPIPEGIERPVLVARRTSQLDDAARRQLVVDAQDSGVARMTATERAQVGRAALTADTLAKLQPGRLAGEANRDFARAFAAFFPRSERNAFIGADKALSADGIRQIQDSLFARAWDAPDIVARAIEAEPGAMKSLLEALAAAASDMAKLRADIEAGLVRPEMDITPFILDAARLIITARDLGQTNKEAAAILTELLAEVDMLDGPVAPLTQALVRVMFPGGKQAPAGKIAEFLTRYADEARKAGRTGDALDNPPGPLDVLKRIDADAFGDLDETGLARPVAEAPPAAPETIPEDAFAEGAASPEAEAADQLALDALTVAEPEAPARGALEPIEDAKAFEAELKKSQPVETMDDIFALAPEAQAFVTDLGRAIEAELGVKFKDPGHKKRETAEEKMGRKSYAHVNQMTDIARGGFVVQTAEQADEVVAMLAAKAGVFDEGWSVSPVSYLDRKVILQAPNGLLAEIQLWTPQMIEAKKTGHKLYTQSRSSTDEAEVARLNEEQRALYSAALAAEDASLSALAGSSNEPNVLANLRFNSSPEGTTRPLSPTSSASTSTQAPPGSSSATARSGESSTAGRPSQSVNTGDVMGETSTRNIGAELGVDKDFELEMPDGTTLRARDILADLDADETLDTVIELCAMKGGADG